MRLHLIAAAAAIALTGPAAAATSGYWDSARVLHAILDSDQVADGLRQQPIHSISRTRDGGYVVQSENCSVGVSVARERASRPGRDDFSLRIARGRCRR